MIFAGDGRVLVAQRPAHKHLGLKWEFPGGKVERGESPADALRREIKEELACDIVLGRALTRFIHDYGTVVIEMIPYLCALEPASAPPHPREHVAIKWVQPEVLPSLDLAPADLPIVEAVLKLQEASRRSPWERGAPAPPGPNESR